jgi:hypothetical protein
MLEVRDPGKVKQRTLQDYLESQVNKMDRPSQFEEQDYNFYGVPPKMTPFGHQSSGKKRYLSKRSSEKNQKRRRMPY